MSDYSTDLKNMVASGLNDEELKFMQGVKGKTFDRFANYKAVRITAPHANSIEDVELIARVYTELEGDFPSIAIAFKSAEDESKVRYITIDAKFATSLKSIKNRIFAIVAGNVAKSDAIDEEDLKADYTNIEFRFFHNRAMGKSDYMLFKTEKIESYSGYCVSESFEYLGVNYPFPTQLENIDRAREIADVCGTKISSNSFTLKKGNSVVKIFRKNEQIEIDGVTYARLLTDDIIVDNDTKIIWDQERKHCEPIKTSTPELRESVYIDGKGSVYIIEGKKIFKVDTVTGLYQKNMQEAKIESKQYTKIIFFDYETVVDFNERSIMIPYSLSFAVFTVEELNLLEKYETTGCEETFQQIKDRTFFKYGFDCSSMLFEYIEKNQANTTFKLASFNGAMFDNHILLSEYLKYKPESISSAFYSGSQLMNFKINYRHTPFDLKKHLVGSLKNNCASFNIQRLKKVEGFDHHEVQQLYMAGKLDTIDKEKLENYNIYDVLSLGLLYKRYDVAVKQLTLNSKYGENVDIKFVEKETYNHATIGSLIKDVFQRYVKEKKIQLPIIISETEKKDQHYLAMLRYKVAGRVDLFNGPQIIPETIASLDVCSAYPTAAAVSPNYYPCGEVVFTESFMPDKIGFYYCDIDQSNLWESNKALIYPKKILDKNDEDNCLENVWNHTEVLKDYFISTVDLETLQKYGCKVNVKSGLYFTDKIKGCELFECLLSAMQGKNNEDTMKANKDPNYNQALREVYKLLMNSLTGKIIERIHTEKTEQVNVHKYNKIVNDPKTKVLNCINCVGSRVFLNYEIDHEALIKSQSPAYLACLIYGYTRRYMYDHTYSKVASKDLIYTDTDSCKIRKTSFEDWIKYAENEPVPHWPLVEEYDNRYKTHKLYNPDTKVFGSFENEYADSNYYNAFIAKKSYLSLAKNKDGSIDAKMKYKGVKSCDIILTGTESFVDFKHYMIGGEPKIKYFIKDEKAAYNYYHLYNQTKRISDDYVGFFEDQFKRLGNKSTPTLVLCESFKKSVKNSKRGASIDDTERHTGMISELSLSLVIKSL